jgi:hypothetical protein
MLRNIIILVFICLVSNGYAQGLLQNEDFKTESELITAGGSKSQLLNDTKVYVTADGINETLDDAISLGLLGFQSPLTTEGDLLSFISGENTRLPIGSEGQLLTVVSGVPAWAAPPVTLPDQSGQSGEYLSTNGTSASWRRIDDDLNSIKMNLLANGSFDSIGIAAEYTITTDAVVDLTTIVTRSGEKAPNNRNMLTIEATNGDSSPYDIKAVFTKTIDMNTAQMKAYCEIRTTRPDVKFIAGANGVAQGEQSVINDGKWRFYEVFLVGGDTSQYIEINGETTASAEPIYVDNCFIGKVSPIDIREVSGAQFVGSLKIAGASGCNVTITSTSFTEFSANTSCNNPVISGVISAPATKKPSIIIQNARTDGFYKVELNTLLLAETADGNCNFLIRSDGMDGDFLEVTRSTTSNTERLTRIDGVFRFLFTTSPTQHQTSSHKTLN